MTLWSWIDTHPAATLSIALLLALFVAASAGQVLGWWDEHRPVSDDLDCQEYRDAAWHRRAVDNLRRDLADPQAVEQWLGERGRGL